MTLLTHIDAVTLGFAYRLERFEKDLVRFLERELP